MNQVVYLDPDNEITSVIEKIRRAQGEGVVLVMPKGSTLTQSIVNLKLMLRSATKEHKVILLVTNDKITKNLASQLGIAVFERASEAKEARVASPVAKVSQEKIPEYGEGPFKVHTYKRFSDSSDEGDQKQEETGNVLTSADESPRNSIQSEEEELEEEGSEDDRSDVFEEENTSEPEEEYEAEMKVEDEYDRPVSKKNQIKIKLGKETPISRPRRKIKAYLSIVGILVVIGIAGAYLAVPKANAILVLDAKNFEKEVPLVISRDQKESNPSAVPATMIDSEKELTKQFGATGIKTSGDKAVGKITISNSWDLNSQTISKGSKFVSKGKTFVSTADVVVPGITISPPPTRMIPGQVEVNVESENPGGEYNIAASDFVITSLPTSKQGSIVGRSTAPMSGGKTVEIKIVSDDDLAKASAALKEEATKQLQAEIADKAGKSSLKLVADCFSNETISMEADKKLNDEAETFQMKLKLKVFSIGYLESNLIKSVNSAVEADLKSDEMLLNSEGSEYRVEKSECILDDGLVRAKSFYKGQVVKKIDAEKLKEEINNMSLGLAASLLNKIDGVKSATIDVTPGFIKWTPVLSRRIEIKLDYSK